MYCSEVLIQTVASYVVDDPCYNYVVAKFIANGGKAKKKARALLSKELATSGRKDCLLWLWSKNKKYFYGEDALKGAVRGGHKDIIEYMLSNFGRDKYRSIMTDLLCAALKRGYLHLLDILIMPIEKKNMWKVYHAAAMSNTISVLEWLESQKIDMNHPSISDIAAENGNLTIIKWLLSRGYNISETAGMNAIHSRRLDMVKWFYERGDGLRNGVWMSSASSGDMKMLKWACGKVFYKEKAIIVAKHAIKSKELKVLKWLDKAGIRFDSIEDHLMRDVIARSWIHCSSLDILKWLHSKGYKNFTGVFKSAIRHEDIPILQWLADNGYAKWTNAYKTALDTKNGTSVLEWLDKQSIPPPYPWQSDMKDRWGSNYRCSKAVYDWLVDKNADMTNVVVNEHKNSDNEDSD
jgi:hypothetical protein